MNKERPILFSTPMVQAILEGRKTQTRRVVKPQPESITPITSEGFMTAPHLAEKFIFHFENGESKEIKLQPEKGDVLWVRETWSVVGIEGRGAAAIYKADTTAEELSELGKVKWKSPYHMPRAACRLFLRVKAVRVERLQDITASDCIDEGILEPKKAPAVARMFMCLDFKKLWDGINAKRGYSWESNPFVKVIEFEPIKDYWGQA